MLQRDAAALILIVEDNMSNAEASRSFSEGLDLKPVKPKTWLGHWKGCNRENPM